MKGNKGLLLISLVVILSLSAVLTNLPEVSAQLATLAVDPPFVDGIALNLGPGSTFYINVTIDDVGGMLAYGFFLRYDTSVLTVASYQSYYPFIVKVGAQVFESEGYMFMGYSYPIPQYIGLYTDVPFAIARIDFTVDDYGYSPLDLYDTELPHINQPPIPHSVTDGSFVNVEIHDVAIAGVKAKPSFVMPGNPISITVTAENQGTFNDTFDVTALYDSNIIGTQTVTDLVPQTSKILIFTWDTTGVADATYTINASASVVSGETDTADNTYTDGKVVVTSTPVHDIAVTSVTASPTHVVVGKENVSISVTVENQGNVPETFNVSVCGNTIVIDTQEGIALFGGDSQTLSFTWNTTGVEWGTYTISANASEVSGETDTADNVFIDGEVKVGLHDINIFAAFADPSSVIIGQNVTISVTVENQGIQNATLTVTAYYNSTAIGTQGITDLAPGFAHMRDVSFDWNTSGVALGTYIISVNASVMLGELDTADNTDIAGAVTVGMHDIAISAVAANPTQVAVGQSVAISVTVKNEGTFTETNVNVTVYRDLVVIGSKIEASLAKGASKTLSFTWNTTGVVPGAYTVKAVAKMVLGETNEENNVKIAGTVTVKLSSTILISVASDTFTVGESTTVSGSITPNPGQGVTVTLLYKLSGATTWSTVTAVTDADGQYSFEWTPTEAGEYEVKTSWAGDATRFGDDSDVKPITVEEAGGGIPLEYIVAGIVIVVVVAVILVYVWKTRKP